MGVIARDHLGEVVGALCTTRPFITEPAMTEAIGAWQTAMFGRRLGLSKVIVEGDSLEVVQALRKEDSCWTVDQ